MKTRPQFRSVFPGDKPVILIVVHVVNDVQTQKSVLAAREGGADGCFLICHSQQGPAFLRVIARDVRGSHPDWWIGLNFLKQTPFVAATFCDDLGGVGDGPAPRANGLWVDNPYAIEHHAFKIAYGQKGFTCKPGFLDITAPDQSPGPLADSLYFAGVDFKYQPPQMLPLRVQAETVSPYCDILTTSGDKTGEPPPKQKMEALRKGAGPEKPIAIASGIDVKNVRQFLPTTQAFLVASSVTDPDEQTNRDKVRALVEAAKS